MCGGPDRSPVEHRASQGQHVVITRDGALKGVAIIERTVKREELQELGGQIASSPSRPHTVLGPQCMLTQNRADTSRSASWQLWGRLKGPEDRPAEAAAPAGGGGAQGAVSISTICSVNLTACSRTPAGAGGSSTARTAVRRALHVFHMATNASEGFGPCPCQDSHVVECGCTGPVAYVV